MYSLLESKVLVFNTMCNLIMIWWIAASLITLMICSLLYSQKNIISYFCKRVLMVILYILLITYSCFVITFGHYFLGGAATQQIDLITGLMEMDRGYFAAESRLAISGLANAITTPMLIIVGFRVCWYQ
jgi:hypothetical protein